MTGAVSGIILAAVVGGQLEPSPASAAQALAVRELGAVAKEVIDVRKTPGGRGFRLMLTPRGAEDVPGICVSEFIDIVQRQSLAPPGKIAAEPLLVVRTYPAFRVASDDLDPLLYPPAEEAARTDARQRLCATDAGPTGYFTAKDDWEASIAARALARLTSNGGFGPGVEVTCNGSVACTAAERNAVSTFSPGDLLSVSTNESCKQRPSEARVLCMNIDGRTIEAGKPRRWGLLLKLVSTDREDITTYNSFRIASAMIALDLNDQPGPDDD